MKILILVVLFVAVCVCTEALVTLKMVRKIDKWVKYLKKERFEEKNRSGKFTYKDKDKSNDYLF
jgi:hypothetical protein